MELSNCLHSCRFYRTIILNYSSEVKQKLGKTLLKSADFSSHNLPKKTTPSFEVAPPGHTIAYKTLIIDN